MRKYVTGLAIVCLMLGVVDCGGSSKSTGPRVKEDGKISVWNQYVQDAIVVYSFGNEAPVTVTLKPNERKEISDTIKGGTKVSIELNVDQSNTRARATFELEVDGNSLIRITNATHGGVVTYQIT